MSSEAALDNTTCEIVVDKVEEKDLGKWRSKQKFHILDRKTLQLLHGFVLHILTCNNYLEKIACGEEEVINFP